jgi:hypothetical protein
MVLQNINCIVSVYVSLKSFLNTHQHRLDHFQLKYYIYSGNINIPILHRTLN